MCYLPSEVQPKSILSGLTGHCLSLPGLATIYSAVIAKRDTQLTRRSPLTRTIIIHDGQFTAQIQVQQTAHAYVYVVCRFSTNVLRMQPIGLTPPFTVPNWKCR